MTQFFKITQKSECFGLSSCVLMPGIIVILLPQSSITFPECRQGNPPPYNVEFLFRKSATSNRNWRRHFSKVQPFRNTHLLQPRGCVNFWSSYLGIRAAVRTFCHLPRHPKSCDHMGGASTLPRNFPAVCGCRIGASFVDEDHKSRNGE